MHDQVPTSRKARSKAFKPRIYNPMDRVTIFREGNHWKVVGRLGKHIYSIRASREATARAYAYEWFNLYEAGQL